MIDLSLLQDFITEATDHLEEMEANLLLLEKDPENREVLNEIFRSIHTIKGASMFVGLPRISELSHKMENLLDLLRQGQKKFNAAIGDTLIEGRDRLLSLIHELEKNQEEASEIDDLLAQILALSSAGPSPAAPPAPKPPQAESQPAAPVAAPVEAADSVGFDDSILGEAFDPSILDGIDQSVLDDSPAEAQTTADLAETLAAALNQKEAEPAAPAWPAAPVMSEATDDDAIHRELAGEANDEELFQIFTQQFAANLDRLDRLISLGTTPENLRSAGECLGNMRSSANYMGYRNLTALLDHCLVTVAPESPDLAALSNCRVRLGKIFENFPRPEPGVAPSIAAAKAPARTVEPATGADEAQIREQISEEIYDAELYKIFLQQLEDNYRQLATMLAATVTPGQERQALAAGQEALTNLKSSANYMGYSHLVNFYEQWLLDVQTTASFMDQGGKGDLIFMRDRLARLRRIFPMLPEKVEPPPQPEAVIPDAVPPKVAAPTAAVPPGKTAKPPAAISRDEEDLFLTLSGSIDAALTDEKGADSTPLHDILEEMLFAESEPQPPPAKPVAPPPVKAAAAPAPKAPEPEPEEESEEEIEERRQDDRRQQDDRREFDRRLSERRQTEDKGDRVLKHSIRVDSQKIDSLMNQVGELVVSRAYFTQIFNDLRNLQQELKEAVGFDSRGLKPIREVTFKLGEATQALSRVSNELQEGVMKIRMLPVSQLFNRYPRLVRDLVKKTDKKIDLIIKGEDTELDKMVIEEISDPMIHIIRNAVDHGLETVAERRAAGKPDFGTLTLEAYHESNHIVIEVTDDGRGIDIDRVKAKAVERGLLNGADLNRISDTEARRFIMMPGFSTAEKATETSGRGVGMDVIKTNIERLNGTVEVESQFGAYTRIRIKIPLTLAIIQALMIRVGGEIFTIPLSVVEETLRILEHDTSIIEGVEVIHLRETTMPIFRLSEIFRIPGAHHDISESFVVIVTTGMQQIGLVVDELIGQEEVVIKPLVDYLREDSGFSGATIIGDGRISLILDIYELVKMTSERQVDRYREQTKKRKIKAGRTGTALPAGNLAQDTTAN